MSHSDHAFDPMHFEPQDTSLLNRYCEDFFCRDATRCIYHANHGGIPASMWVRDRMDAAHCDEFQDIAL